MKIKKKTLIYILGFLAVLLLAIAVFLLLSYIGRNKYNELRSKCMNSTEASDFSCTALLNSYEDNLESTCFTIAVIGTSSISEDVTICEKKKKIKIDESILGSSEVIYPVNLNFIFNKDIHFVSLIERTEISLIEGDELDKLLDNLNSMSIDTSNVYIREVQQIRDNGYALNTQVEISEDKVLDTITILTLEISNIDFIDNRFLINSQVTLLDKLYTVQFDTRRIIFPPDEQDGERIVLVDLNDLENYELDLPAEASVTLVYINQIISNKELEDFYIKKGDNASWKLLYDELRTFEIDETNAMSVDEYIRTQTDSASDGVLDLSKLIPVMFVIK